MSCKCHNPHSLHVGGAWHFIPWGRHKEHIRCLTFRPTQGHILAGTDQNNILLFPLSTGEPVGVHDHMEKRGRSPSVAWLTVRVVCCRLRVLCFVRSQSSPKQPRRLKLTQQMPRMLLPLLQLPRGVRVQT